MLDEDYKRAGFRLLPTGKQDKISALMVFLSTLIMIPTVMLPFYFGFGGWIVTIISVLGAALFSWYGWQFYRTRDIASAKKVMFTSFFYLPVIQLVLLFDFIAI